MNLSQIKSEVEKMVNSNIDDKEWEYLFNKFCRPKTIKISKRYHKVLIDNIIIYYNKLKN